MARRRRRQLGVGRVRRGAAAQPLHGPVCDDIVDEATRGATEEGGALLLAPLAFQLVQ